jgi:hypothetical protein
MILHLDVTRVLQYFSKEYYIKISITASLLTIFVITDILLSNLAPGLKIAANFIQSNAGIMLFIVLSIASAAGQLFILNYVKEKATKLWLSKLRLKQIHSIMRIGQYILISVIFTLVFQIVLFEYYDVILLSAVTTISYCLNYIILTTLAIRLLQWYLLKHDPVILVFSIGSFAGAIAAIATISFSILIFGSNFPYASPETSMAFPTLVPGTLQYNLNNLNFVFSIISFIAIWCGAVLLLRHYSNKFGTKTYWVLVCTPLVYFLSQFANIFHLYEPFIVSNLNAFFQTFQLVYSLNSAIGGVLFGIVFWTASKKMEHISSLKIYLTITGFGFFLFFASGSATLVQVPYPPYGLQMVSIVGLSSYMIFFGLYSLAIILSEDVKVRQAIRNSAIEQSKLLGNISYAEMEHKITDRVIHVVKNISDKIVQDSGLETSYKDYDIKDEVRKVLEEIKNADKFSNPS